MISGGFFDGIFELFATIGGSSSLELERFVGFMEDIDRIDGAGFGAVVVTADWDGGLFLLTDDAELVAFFSEFLSKV